MRWMACSSFFQFVNSHVFSPRRFTCEAFLLLFPIICCWGSQCNLDVSPLMLVATDLSPYCYCLVHREFPLNDPLIFFIEKHSEAPKNQTVNSKSPITPLPLRCKQETDISRMFRFFQHFGQSQCQRSLLLSWCFCGTLTGPYSGHLGLARDLAL